MGTTYYVACLDCKVIEDLDKFWIRPEKAFKTRKDALEGMEDLINYGLYSLTIFAAFMSEHAEHKCQVFSEYDDAEFREILELYDNVSWESRRGRSSEKWGRFSYDEIYHLVNPLNVGCHEDLWDIKNVLSLLPEES